MLQREIEIDGEVYVFSHMHKARTKGAKYIYYAPKRGGVKIALSYNEYLNILKEMK